MKASPVGASNGTSEWLFDLNSRVRAAGLLFQKIALCYSKRLSKGPCICDLLLRGSKYGGLCYIGYLVSMT